MNRKIRSLANTKQQFLQSLFISAIWILILWFIWGIGYFTNSSLAHWGILPRKASGLIGIISSPFIHSASYDHLLSNSVPLFILWSSVHYFYRPISWRVLGSIVLITGIWVWAAARPAYHIGASGVVYGLAFFLFFSGVFRKDRVSLAIALIVVMFYGGMVWGVFPNRPNVSWEAHLFGALSGILLAYFYRNKIILAKKYYSWELQEESDNGLWNYKDQFQPPEGFKYPDS